MSSDESKDYLWSKYNGLSKKIEQKIKIAVCAFAIAAVLILILPIYTAIPRGTTEMGYVETINWWAAGFALAAAIYGFIQYTIFDGTDNFKYGPRFIAPAAIAIGAILLFAGLWFLKGPELAEEYEGSDSLFDVVTTSYKMSLVGPCAYLVCMAIGSILIESTRKPLDELIKVEQILRSGE